MVDFKLEGIVRNEPSFNESDGFCAIPLSNPINRTYITKLGDSEQAKNLKNAAERTEVVTLNNIAKPSIRSGCKIVANYILNSSNPQNWRYDLLSVDLLNPHNPMQVCATFYHTPNKDAKR